MASKARPHAAPTALPCLEASHRGAVALAAAALATAALASTIARVAVRVLVALRFNRTHTIALQADGR